MARRSNAHFLLRCSDHEQAATCLSILSILSVLERPHLSCDSEIGRCMANYVAYG